MKYIAWFSNQRCLWDYTILKANSVLVGVMTWTLLTFIANTLMQLLLSKRSLESTLFCKLILQCTVTVLGATLVLFVTWISAWISEKSRHMYQVSCNRLKVRLFSFNAVWLHLMVLHLNQVCMCFLQNHIIVWSSTLQ